MLHKISKAFKAATHIVRNPWLLNYVLDSSEVRKKYIIKKYNMPAGFPVIYSEDLFDDFNVTIEPFSFLEGGSLPTDHALLKKLASLTSHCKYFEIGTWRGESVANVASVAEQCYTLNLSAKEMEQQGLSQEYINLHRFFSSGLPKVTHLEGNSKTYDFASLNQKFDLIFIDGDHHYESVKSDTMKVFKHLVHEQSVVVWHDYGYNPEVPRFDVMAGILDGCPEQFRDKIYHFAHSMSAIFINKPIKGRKLTAPVRPDRYYKVDIKEIKIK